MTAPGNSTVLVVLLAAFIACSAYAAGRLHQRLRTGRDRDEAYRDGYDTATRSVFSLAARIIGPRKSAAVRGSAKVPAVSPPASSGRRRSRLASYRDNARTLPRTTTTAVSDSDEDTTLLPPSPHVSDGNSTLPGSSPVRSGRHTAPDELVQAATYRLTADRVARAQMHGSGVEAVSRGAGSRGAGSREAGSREAGSRGAGSREAGSRGAGSRDEQTTRLPPVPRPRSS